MKGRLARIKVPRGRGRNAVSGHSLRSALLKALEYVVIGTGLLATAFVSAFITFSMAIRGNEITVPNLVGASLVAAGQRLSGAELNLRHEGNRFDDTMPPNLIAAQTPVPGTALKPGRSVRVWTSLGPHRRVVPRIEGESIQSAQHLLGQEGFTLGRVVEVHSEAYAPDSIIAQNPPPYEEAGEATEVSVLLSRGYVAKAYVMPDFIGHDYSDVLDGLRGGSMKIDTIRMVDYSGVAHGTVVRQTPRAGTKVFNRDRIVLYVSKGNR